MDIKKIPTLAEKIEIVGLKTILKLCKFGADHNMESCTFTEIVERMFSKIEQMKTQVNTLDEMLLNQGEALAQAKAQAVPEGFLLVGSKDLLDLTVAINALDLATHTESKTNEVREMWQDIALKLMALGEAQEQSHE